MLPALGIALTSLRLYYRHTRRHLGWDDAWAAFCMFCAFFLTAGAWTRSDTPRTFCCYMTSHMPLGCLIPALTEVGPFHHGPRVRILGYYMLNVAFTCVLWCVFQFIDILSTADVQRVCSIHRSARLSILFSIIRLIPYLMRLRVYANMAAVLFGCMWVALIILKITVCETRPEWKQTQGVQCVLGPAVGGVELASACFGPSVCGVELTASVSV